MDAKKRVLFLSTHNAARSRCSKGMYKKTFALLWKAAIDALWDEHDAFKFALGGTD